MRGWHALLLFAATALGEEIAAVDALDLQTCEALRDELIPRIEAFAQLKFRGPVALKLPERAKWSEEAAKGRLDGKTAVYTTGRAEVLVITPWRLKGHGPMTKQKWLAEFEPFLIHGLTHALLRQNLPFASRPPKGSRPKRTPFPKVELARWLVPALLEEGVAGLAALRVARLGGKSIPWPTPQLESPKFYQSRFDQEPTRSALEQLIAWAPRDGLDLLHHFSLTHGAGLRKVRCLLYRPPPLALLVQPELLAELPLDQAPDPGEVFHVLGARNVPSSAIRLAVNPGKERFFGGTSRGRWRAPGCLIGYAAQLPDADYAFFIADPDDPGNWAKEQRWSLRDVPNVMLKEFETPVPGRAGMVVSLLSIEAADKSRLIRAERKGLVVVAYEKVPADEQLSRLLVTLGGLEQFRPTPKLYDAALAKARERLPD